MLKAQFLGGQVFWDMVTAFRVLKIEGRYGAGKTSLAFIVAARLFAEGRVKRTISNIPCTFAQNTVPDGNGSYVVDGGIIPVPLFEAAIVLDEAWIYIEDRRDVLDYAGFVRHYEHFLILPSVMDIHPRLSFFTAQRVFNGYTVGLPIWFYRWDIRQKRVREMGYFAIQNPTAIFGHYAKKFTAGSDGGISDAVDKTSKGQGFQGTRSRQRQAKTAEVSFSTMEDNPVADIENAFDEASQDMQYVLEDIQRATKKASIVLRR